MLNPLAEGCDFPDSGAAKNTQVALMARQTALIVVHFN